MNKAKRLIRAKRKAKARRCGTYQPTKFKLGQAFVDKVTANTAPDNPSTIP